MGLFESTEGKFQCLNEQKEQRLPLGSGSFPSHEDRMSFHPFSELLVFYTWEGRSTVQLAMKQLGLVLLVR